MSENHENLVRGLILLMLCLAFFVTGMQTSYLICKNINTPVVQEGGAA